MKGDFTRNTFDPEKNFTRVLMQQGRVLLDSDWNEQSDIQQHYLRKLAVDLIGPHAGPIGPNGETAGYPGFSITLDGSDLKIGFGSYYVDGIRCENKKHDDGKDTTYYGLNGLKKSDYELPKSPYLVYLDVWEHHITFLEDDSIREVALGGPDTTTRSKVAWLVRVWPLTEDGRNLPTHLKLDRDNIDTNLEKWKSFLGKKPNGLMKAQVKIDAGPKKIEPCAIYPEARYSGPENRLYRVEIHAGGDSSVATFKWSRDNGSVVFPVRSIGIGKNGLIRAALEHLGLGDDRKGLNEGDWVEFVSEEILLQNEVLQAKAEPLMQVQEIEKTNKVVYLKSGNFAIIKDAKSSKPLLRRWDHRAGDPKKNGLELVEGAARIKESAWLNLEDGIQVSFSPSPNTNGNDIKNFYRTGDYWLIPARTATGNVQWPQSADGPTAISPHGVEHHYAPLKIMGVASGDTDCRRKIKPLWDHCNP
jgi:hypothetical protein